jgi:S1-C subfamily serine protease
MGLEVAIALVVGVLLGVGAHALTSTAHADAAVGTEVAGISLERSVGIDDQVADLAARAVLRVDAVGCGEQRQASATLVRADDGRVLMLTNAHVVKGSGTVEVQVGDGTVVSVPVLGALAGRDAVLLDADALLAEVGDDVASPAAAGGEVALGAPLAVAGYPGGSARVDATYLADVQRRVADGVASEVMLTGSTVIGGSSGGAVMDDQGRVVGLVAARDRSTGQAVAHPLAGLLDASLVAPPGC